MVRSGSAATRIAGYDNAVEIGRGGFAVVYRARRVEFDQDVAIKVLDPTTADEHGVARLARERRILGLLAQHPNVVTVYDAGMTADGAQYLVMEYLPGGSLGDRLAREGPLDVRRVVDYAVRLCGALETAHRAGVLHRDIKPDNILVSRFGEPVLADFGIARVQGGMQTRSGVITATVSHAPPEVLDGDRPTARSDVYSFASTLFTLLVGSSPFARAGDYGITPLIARVLRDPVPDLRPRGIPAQVCALLERALAKNPDDRPASAVEFGQAFQRVQRELGWPVSTMVVEDLDPADLDVPDPEPEGTVPLRPPDLSTVPPGPTTIRTERPAGGRRRRLRLLLIATAVVTVVALAAVIVVPLLNSPPPADPTAERRGGPGTVTFAGAVNPAPGRADLEVLDFGFTAVPTDTGSWLTSYAIRLRNPNPSQWLVSSATLTVRFTDDRGVVLGDGQEQTSYTIVPNGTDAVGPDPGLSSYDGGSHPLIEPPAYTIRPTRMNIEVGDVTWDRVDTRVPGALTAGPAELRMRPDEPGSFGSRADVECALTSTAAVLIDMVSVTVVLRDEAGAIVAGEEALRVTDATGEVHGVNVTPAATTPLNLRLDSVPPTAVSAECYPDYFLPTL